MAEEPSVGDVVAFSIAGLKCYFGSNDHFPQHFEVLKRGNWVIRVFFLRSTRVRGLSWEYKKQWKGAFGSREEAIVLRLVLANKRLLLQEWRKRVCQAQDSEVGDHERIRKSTF